MKTDKNAQKNKKQQTVLGILIAVILVVVGIQYFHSPDPAEVNAKADKKYDGRQRYDAVTTDKPTTPGKGDAVQVVNNTDPGLQLDLTALKGSDKDIAVDRNLFIYPPPPPPPQPPPPKPATIPISRVTPTSVFAQTKAFEMVVTGQNFTSEDRIYLNGNPGFSATKFVSAGELHATVPQQYFTSPQQMRVEVKRPGQEADFFSNALSINIAAPPVPRFEMLGQFNDGGGKNPHAVLTEGDNRFVVGIGDRVNNMFKVVNIGPNFVEVEDVTTAIGVRHQKTMKEVSAGPNPYGQQTAFNQPAYQQQAEQPQYNEVVAPTTTVDQVNQDIANINQNNQQQNDQQNQLNEAQKKQQELARQQREDLMRRRQEAIQQRLNNPSNRR